MPLSDSLMFWPVNVVLDECTNCCVTGSRTDLPTVVLRKAWNRMNPTGTRNTSST